MCAHVVIAGCDFIPPCKQTPSLPQPKLQGDDNLNQTQLTGGCWGEGE